MEFAPVRAWYSELRWMVAMECMTMLQSKSLAALAKRPVVSSDRRSDATTTTATTGGSRLAASNTEAAFTESAASSRSGSAKEVKSAPCVPASATTTTAATFTKRTTPIDHVRERSLDLESPVVFAASPVSSASTASISQPPVKTVDRTASQITTKEHIDLILDRAQAISAAFARLFRRVEKRKGWKPIHTSSIRIVEYLRLLVEECGNAVHDPGPNIWEHEEAIVEGSATLEDDLERLHHSVDPCDHIIMERLMSLGHSFSRLVDAVIGQLIQKLVHQVATAKSAHLVLSSLDQLIRLSLDGEHMCFLIAREGGVTALFDICLDEKMKFSWAMALRTLAALCCVNESVQELEGVNGVHCLATILDRLDVDEATRAEAAGVIAQATSPSSDRARYLHGFLENIDHLTRTLTGLCDEASNGEVFLLGAAALANITFMDSLSCEYLHHYHTARVLIEACQMHKANSLFAKDQVVTVIANMATIDACCVEITSYNGIELLIHFLQSNAALLRNSRELDACERVQQKTAVALTRLARNPDIAQIIVECQGVQRLVTLCRDPRERNNSDVVLMACVTALKRISRVCPDEDFTEQDVDNLLQSSLVDSFLSSNMMEETFV